MPGSVRIAELVATLSYAADLGLGQPMEHCLRQTVIALRLAELTGADPADRAATYYLGLLMNAYCHADAAEQSQWFGDDISFKADSYEMLGMSTVQTAAFLLRRLASHGSALQRVRRVAAFPLSGQRTVESWLTTHSTLGARFAETVGLGDTTVTALRQAYEQWDGKGAPAHLSGAGIGLPSRLVQFAGPIEVIGRRHGVDQAVRIARRHAGTLYDPELAALFVDHASTVLDDLDTAAGWNDVLAAEPGPVRSVAGDELDEVLGAMADLVDLKSPYLAGHSRGVAQLAAHAAMVSGLAAADQRDLLRAGLLHDLGRLGVANSIWDKPGTLGEVERERTRLHPYLTDKMLQSVEALARSREIAAKHHERLDGSGYPRGLTAAALTPLDRLLAAADVFHAMLEPRPHRPALAPAEASAQLQADVSAGRLDGDAVNAVLRAAGHRAPVRREHVAGLTAREIDVLALLARGQANKQIARELGVTPKTVSNHVEHLYAKLGVRSRAAATLFATRHGLVGGFEPSVPRDQRRGS
ncbi:HD domain-containing phosphohydrolase [Kribbella sp. NPDC026611]|uniref:HD domain-containing phosphohydrolase n=1 Tax=Kribbella sp. NPDC026611 TaxID=3154911 RepID=UPI0033DFF5AC